VFLRFGKEKSDDVGNEYFAYCGAAELHDYASALALSEAFLGQSMVADVRKVVADLYPQAANLSKGELEAKSAQFRYRSILRYVATETPLLRKEVPALARMVPMYARLSSFVHGGPSSHRDMYGHDSPERLQQCRDDAELVFIMTASVLQFTALVVSREFPEQRVVADRVRAIVRLLDGPRGGGPVATREGEAGSRTGRTE
jgi:hypothetical protein